MSDTLTMKLSNGAELPLRQTVSQRGNAFWATLAKKSNGERYYSRYGVTVSAAVVGSKVPASAEILGTTIGLAADTSDKGQPRLKGSGTVVVPGHGKKAVSVRITITEQGPKGEIVKANVSASVNGISGGATHVLDEL